MRGKPAGMEIVTQMPISLKHYKIYKNARLLLTNRAKEYIIDNNTRYCGIFEMQTLYLVFSAFTSLPADSGKVRICCIF